MKIFLFCLFFLGLTIGTSSGLFAHYEFQLPEVTDGQINEALAKTVPLRFLPSHPLYILISIKETFSRVLKPSAVQRSQFDLVLCGKRLKEAYLLIEKNDIKLSGKALVRYSQRLDQMTKQLEKARSQNQDAADLVGEMADTLKHHEVLLSAVNSKWQNKEDKYNFDESFQKAISSFSKTILTIDNLSPGIRDRFQLFKSKDVENEGSIMPLPSPSPSVEASPSARPRRIIY